MRILPWLLGFWLIGLTFAFMEATLDLDYFFAYYTLRDLLTVASVLAALFLGVLVERHFTAQFSDTVTAPSPRAIAAVVLMILLVPQFESSIGWLDLIGSKVLELSYLGSFVAGLLLGRTGLALITASSIGVVLASWFLYQQPILLLDNSFGTTWWSYALWIAFALLGRYSANALAESYGVVRRPSPLPTSNALFEHR